jgi:hypothetical protein
MSVDATVNDLFHIVIVFSVRSIAVGGNVAFGAVVGLVSVEVQQPWMEDRVDALVAVGQLKHNGILVRNCNDLVGPRFFELRPRFGCMAGILRASM